ncbi:MAG: hypothetical protein ACRERU_21400 [Methylococcales bacterium]
MATRKRPSKTAESNSAKEQSVNPSAEDVPMPPEPEKPADQPRFHFFIIDSGWKSHSARVLRENFRMIREFENHDPLYVLTREQSIALIRANPDLIGKDPILLVHDLHAQGGRGASGYHGFRLCLGVLKNAEQALRAMQQFLRFIANHRASTDIEQDIRKQLHRQGMEGAIQVIREGAAEMMA